MPWVTLPHPVAVGGFRFSPIDAKDPAPVVGTQIAETVAQVLRLYVDRSGRPIKSCTIVLRPRHPQAWNIPEWMWRSVSNAADMLALACLAEHRFFEQPIFRPHLNASMFSVIGQGITAGSDGIALHFVRRGGRLRITGLSFKDVLFQRPHQVEGTECKVIGTRLLKALDAARRTKNSVWMPIASSAEFFLLGHSETPELSWDSCVMLSAMAYEQLLESESRAQAIAEEFARLWAPYCGRTMDQAKRVKPDPKYVNDQRTWPLHRKWMKELYEARSAKAHGGPRADFSQNWKEWQHLVIAGFAYPLAVKLRLKAAGLYQLNEREQGACEALDELLDSHWGKGWREPPEWSDILTTAESRRALERAINESLDEERSKPRRRRSSGRHPASYLPSYD